MNKREWILKMVEQLAEDAYCSGYERSSDFGDYEIADGLEERCKWLLTMIAQDLASL